MIVNRSYSAGQSSRLVFEQRPLSHIARLLNSSWLFLIPCFGCAFAIVGQLDLVWYEILVFAIFIGLLFGWPIVANYNRFAIYILDVSVADKHISFRYLDSDSEKSLTIQKQRLKIEDKLLSKPGIFRVADHQISVYEDEELMLTIHDYQSFTGSFYTEKLVKNLEEAGVRRI